MNVGIFGGAFNPPHIAHLIIAETVREQSALDRVLWIPNGQPPHKAPRDLAPATDRLTMTRLATQENPAFAVSEIEVHRAETSYTVDTVRALQQAQPETSFSLIVGGDSLAAFDSWYRPDEIAARVPLVVYRRTGFEAVEVPARFAGRVHFVEAPLLEISATYIRAHRRAGRSLRYLVPEPVRAHIEARGLYL